MYRRKAIDNNKEDASQHVFTEIIAAVIFFMILFIFIQQLRFIEVFEREKVKVLQTFLENQLEDKFEARNLQNRSPDVDIDPNSPLIQKIVMNNNTLRFESGRANLQTRDDTIIIDLIGEVLRENQEIIAGLEVQGHTDTVRISENNKDYATNWELSAARAVTVVRRMTEAAGFPSEKISAVSFSKFQPNDPDDPYNNALNRRIAFLIRYSYDPEFMDNGKAREIYQFEKQ